MSMNKIRTILTLLVLLATPITAQAFERGKVERFATLPPGEAHPEGICRGPRGQRLRGHRGGEQDRRRVAEHSLCSTRTANTCGPFTIAGSTPNGCLTFASIPRTGQLLVIDYKDPQRSSASIPRRAPRPSS